MRSVLLRSLAVIGVGGLVLAGVLYVASTVDARPPTVTRVSVTQPIADDDRTALITTSIEVVFSEPVVTDDAARALAILPAVEGSVSWSGSTLIFTPADPLELETEYRLTIDAGIRDLAGNEMDSAPPAFEFATAGRPALVETDPLDGAQDVALDLPIRLAFSTLMDTESVESALQVRPTFAHDLRWSGRLLEIVPEAQLRAGLDYEITVQAGATDIAGVALEEPITLTFRTVAAGLVVERVIPADEIDGIALATPIGIVFDRPIDPESVSGELFEIRPDVSGTLEVVSLTGEPSEDGAGRVLLFSPSSPLPANTTFDVAIAPGIEAAAGGVLTTEVTWRFTTGAPLAAISNQVTFLSERSGIANVWVMNSDGTGKRQLSSELGAIVDYAVAPDGTTLVVSDGYRLVHLRADGSERQVLTDDGHLEFDPAFAPDGDHVAFARADAVTGAGLGLWEWPVRGGDANAIELPPALGAEPSPSSSPSTADLRLRHPRYAPDGQALAYVDLDGWVGIVELPAERLTRVAFVASAPPVWMPGSASVLLTGQRADPSTAVFEPPVTPLEPGPRDEIFRFDRSATAVRTTPLGVGARVIAVDPDGRVAYADADGQLWLTDDPMTTPDRPIVADEIVTGGAFGPGGSELVVAIASGEDGSRLDLLEPGTGRLGTLVGDGRLPLWLP